MSGEDPWALLRARGRAWARRRAYGLPPSHACMEPDCATQLPDAQGHVLCAFHVVSKRLERGLDRWGQLDPLSTVSTGLG